MPSAFKTHKPPKPDSRLHSAAPNDRQRRRYLHTGSAQWRAIREAQLDRYPLCEDCGGPAIEVDHNTDDTSRNLIGIDLSSMCKPCHSVRTRRRMIEKSRRTDALRHALPAANASPRIGAT